MTEVQTRTKIVSGFMLRQAIYLFMNGTVHAGFIIKSHPTMTYV